MKTSAILLVLVMALVVSVFFAYASGFVVVNPKAVPRVEVKADVVDSDFIWNKEDGHYDLNMPSTCGKSNEELYQAMIRRFPRGEARLDSLSLNDIRFMMPDDDPYWHDVIFKHWKEFGTINIVFYNALVAKKQFYSFEDAEEFIRRGGI